MCRECIKTPSMERGRSILDTGAYVMNYKGCNECNRADLLQMGKVTKKETKNGEEDIESISYSHVCQCGHLVAEHLYKWTCSSTTHHYLMECELCGVGEEDQEIYMD